MGIHSTDDVLTALDGIIERSVKAPSRLGYFAALYRGVTAQVKAGIEGGRFQDPERMERLDVIFANRYLGAFDAFDSGSPLSQCWALTFREASRWRPLALQHLLLGMNAHINLDLGLAAAQACPGDALAELEADFTEINAILSAELDNVQRRLARISRFLGVLDLLGGRNDEAIVNFSMRRARAAAWKVAQDFAFLGEEDQPGKMDQLDGRVTWIGRRIARPGPYLSALALFVRLGENRDVGQNIAALLEEAP